MARMAARYVMDQSIGALKAPSFPTVSIPRHFFSKACKPTQSSGPLLTQTNTSIFCSGFTPKSSAAPSSPSIFSFNTPLRAAFSSLLKKTPSTSHPYSATAASARGFCVSGIASQVPTAVVTRSALPSIAAGRAAHLAARRCFSSSAPTPPVGGSLVSRLVSLAATRGARAEVARGLLQSHSTGDGWGRAGFLAVAAIAVSAKQGSLRTLLQAPIASCEEVMVPRVEVVEGSEWTKLKRWFKRAWVPIVVLVWLIFGMNHPRLLIANTALIVWCTKPYEESLGPWLEERRLQRVLEKEGLDQLKSQINPLTRLAKLDVEDYVFFQLATAQYLHEKLTLVGALGDWWIISTTRPTIIGLQPLQRQS